MYTANSSFICKKEGGEKRRKAVQVSRLCFLQEVCLMYFYSEFKHRKSVGKEKDALIKLYLTKGSCYML